MPVTATELGLRGTERKSVTATDLGLQPSVEERDLVPAREPMFPEGRSMVAPVGQEQEANEAAEAQARFYNRVSNAVGGNFSPEPIDEFDLIYDLARSDKPSEKVQKFKFAYPQGEALFVPTDQKGTVMIGRKTPDEPFHLVSNQVAEVAEPLTNLRTVGGVLGAGVRGHGGIVLGLATRLGAVAGGTTLGGLIESERERFRGFEEEERAAAYSEELGFGLTAGAIDALTMGAGKMASPFVRGAVGRGIGKAPSREQIIENIELGKTIEATDLLGLPPLTRGQIGVVGPIREPNPLIQGMYWQSTSTTGVGQAQMRAARKQAREQIKEWAKSDFRGMSDDELGRLIRRQTRLIDRVLARTDITQAEMGDQLQKAFKGYQTAMTEAKDRLYDAAFTIDDSISFDISPVKDINKVLVRGTPARGAAGRTATGKFAPREEVALKGRPKKVVRDVMDDIEKLDPILTKYVAKDGTISKGFEQLSDLRTRLFDARFDDHGPTRRAANVLWKALSDVMDNPVGGSDDFVKAFRKARAANRILEANLEKRGIAQVLKAEDPGQVAARYIRPDNPNTLRTIRNIAGPKYFKNVQNYFKAQLMEDPKAGLRTLRKFEANPKVFQLLVPTKRERLLLRKRLEKEAKLLDSPLSKEFEKEALAGERAMDIIRKGTAKQMKDLVDSAGGRESELAQNLKAGLFRRALEVAEESSDKTGELLLDPVKLDNFVTQLQQSDKFDILMTGADRKVWDNLRRWAAVNRGDVDAGGQIVRGQIQSGITEPGRAQRALYKIGSFGIVAHILSKPALRKHLSTGADFDIDKLRGMVQAMQQMEKEDPRIPTEYTPSHLRD